MRTIGVVTTSRAEYSIIRVVLRRIVECDDLCLQLFVGGQHLQREYGRSVDEITRDGFEVTEALDFLQRDDSPLGIGLSMSYAMRESARAYAKHAPDLILVTADRFEMFAACAAAVAGGFPIAHIGGGDVTLGAFDDTWRDCMSRMADIHFVWHEQAKQRLVRLGEDELRIHVTGNPALDDMPYFDNAPTSDYLLVVFHPVTLEPDHTEHYITELLDAIKVSHWPAVFISGNSDTYGGVIRRKVRDYCAHSGNNAKLYANVSHGDYLRLMYNAAALVGNSSSGLLEAPSLSTPVVNVGNRQAGRLRAKNVIDVDCTRNEILAGIKFATSREFTDGMKGVVNPYGDGNAAERVVKVLRDAPLEGIIKKQKAAL